jgi:hypothetical protein
MPGITTATIANAPRHAGRPPAQARPVEQRPRRDDAEHRREHEAEAAVRRTLDVLFSGQVFMCHGEILV